MVAVSSIWASFGVGGPPIASDHCEAIEAKAEMKLRTKLLLATTVTALAVLGISEWLSYQETIGFLRTHLAEMSQTRSAHVDAQSLEAGVAALSGRLIWIHLGHAALEALALVIVLTLFWNKFVLRPIGKILDQMNAMGHSVTCRALPVDREDELGQMAGELNRLGGNLSTALEHAATASELASLALMGRTLIRKVLTVRDQLAPALRAVAQAHKDGTAPPDSAVASLEIVLERLSSLPDVFEEEFEKRLDERGRRPAQPPFVESLQPPSGATPARS